MKFRAELSEELQNHEVRQCCISPLQPLYLGR